MKMGVTRNYKCGPPKNACVVDQFCRGTFALTIHQVEVTKCSMITDVLPFVYVTMKMGVTLKYVCV